MKEHEVWQYADDKGKRAEFCNVDFSWLSLKYTQFLNCNLKGAKAPKVDFTQSIITYCDLSYSTCRGANFQDTELNDMTFSNCGLF